MRDYSTLHLDTNTSKGTTLLLVFSVHSFHCHSGVFNNVWISKPHTLKWVRNGPYPAGSRAHEYHYGMWHTALWSCTHIPNIIDLSGKTKKLWSGQASLRRSSRRRGGSRSRRKNQTKTICLPSFEGET
jgi:hypothetical protein